MSVVVQLKGFQNLGPTPFNLAFDNPVALGNIIVVYFASGNGLDNLALVDNLGNTYSQGARVGGAEALFGLYAPVTFAGSPTIHCIASTGVIPFGISAILMEIQGQGRTYIQGQAIIGAYVPSIGGIFPDARDTGPLTPSGDAVIISCRSRQAVLLQAASASGDTLIGWDSSPVVPPFGQPFMAAFEQEISGTGQALQILLETNQQGGAVSGGGQIAAMCFSKALPRPGGLVAQYAVSPGRGWADNSLASPSDGSYLSSSLTSQRTVTVTLPYTVQLGSLLYFILTQDNRTGPTFTVPSPDAYGNTWTPIAGADDAQNSAKVKAYYCFIAHLPPAGQCFQQSFTLSGSFSGGTTFQTPGAFLVEYADVTAGVPTGTNGLSAVGGPPTLLSTRTLTVPDNTRLTAVATLGLSDSWTAQESYTIRRQWTNPFFFDPGSPNDDRMATIALEDKIVSAGTYDAQIIGNNVGEWGMVLIAIQQAASPLTIACPVFGGTATVGVPYDSGPPVVSGGVPPYTYALTAGSGPLPPGLTLNGTTGHIEGTPSASGVFHYEIRVTDSLGNTAVANCAISVSIGPPPFCIVTPPPSFTPTLTSLNEPLEQQGS